MAVRITCVNKPSGNNQNPHEAISHYGWVNEQTGERKITPRVQMVEWVEQNGSAYVKDVYGNIAHCGVRTSIRGTKYLQTYTDGKYSDNLLSLPACSL